MILECTVIGNQDPEKAKEILGRVAGELIREGKIKFTDSKLENDCQNV